MKKEIKVLIISPTCFPSIGGIQSYLKNVLYYLKDYCKIDILTANLNSHKFDKEIIDGFVIYKVPAIAPDNSYFLSPWLIHYYKKNVKKYDIIHIHGYHNLFPLVMFFSGKKPIVLTPHYHTRPKKRTRDLLFKIYNLTIGRFFMYRSNHIIVNNKLSEKLLLKLFSTHPSRITILPEGIISHCDVREVKKGTINNPVFLYVGRLEKNKGIYRVFSVFIQILKSYSKASLVFVGSGKEKENLYELIRKRKLEKQVRILSNIPDNELSEQYCKANIFFMLSDYESFGIALAEAIASGIPSIGVKRGGVVEYAIDRKNCLLVDNPNDYEKILQFTRELLENENLRNLISQNGKKIIYKCSWEKNALNTLKIYEHLVFE